MKTRIRKLWIWLQGKKWKMTTEEATAYKDEYQILSPTLWDEGKQEWTYDHIPEAQRVAGDAQGCKVSRETMKKLYQMFPDRNDKYSNKKLYTSRQMNQAIRSAIAQNYRKL